MRQNLKGTLLLLLTAFLWGSAFVAQKAGMEYIGPFTFNGVRSFIGGIFLIPAVVLIVKRARNVAKNSLAFSPDALSDASAKKNLMGGGVLCGICLFTASSLQQIGIVYTTSGKAGFITAMYMLIVPLLGLVMGKRPRRILWICVAIAIAGLYLLTMSGKLDMNKGDLLILGCSVVFAFHFMVIDYFSPRTNAVGISCIQLFVTGLLSIPFMTVFESVDWRAVLNCWSPIIYAGILSCGVAYTLQIVAQRYVEPTVASLTLSLESVFAVLTGMIILGEVLSGREAAGCILMFGAILLSQLPPAGSGNDDNGRPQK